MKADQQVDNPFPGLRPFRRNEDYLFFGRESQVDAMVDKLAATRFLAVVGPSGSGKSSLVNCGLEPTLYRGLMATAGTRWLVAHMRPGIDPIGHLAEALGIGALLKDFEAAHLSAAELIKATLRMSKRGLIDIFEQARLPENANLLVVVDQFEELFRYSKLAKSGLPADTEVNEDSIAFVNLILATRTADVPIYVVLTMRSDFLGDCAKFAGLPEAINASQYLIPRMSRDERRAAITGPVHVSGAEITPVLVTRLVNDVSDNPDQLSVLQHALNRTWAYWENRCGREGPIDLKHYEAIGTMAKALDAHAERAFAELETPARKALCERIFKVITDKATDPRGIRRPVRFGTLCAIVHAPAAEVASVIDVFRKPSRSFLMPPAGEELNTDTVVDISHESLMRGWNRLSRWAEEEAESARIFTRLAEAAALYEDGKASLWRDPELQLALAWRARERPTREWSRQYREDFDRAIRFLEESRTRQHLRLAAKASSLVLAVGILFFGWWLWNRFNSANLTALATRALHQGERAGWVATNGDPLEGSLNALRALASIGDMPRDDTFELPYRSLENALWQSHARTHMRHIVKDHMEELRSVDFSRHGTQMATGSYDGTALIYDTESWAAPIVIHEDNGDPVDNTSNVLGVSFSPDGRILATGSMAYPKGEGRKGRLRLWDTKTGAFVGELTGSDDRPWAHEGPVRTVAFSPSGRLLVTSSYDNTARVWNVPDRKRVGILKGHKVNDDGRDVYDAAFDPVDPSIVATGGNDGVVRLWNLDDIVDESTPLEDNIPLGGHRDRIQSVAFSPDGKWLISSSDDDTVRVWDMAEHVQDGKPLAGHKGDIWKAIYDAVGKTIFTASWDRSIGVWDTATFNLEARLHGHAGPIRALDYSLFKGWLASGSTDLTARIWSLEADDIHYRLDMDGHAVNAVRVNPSDPSVFATGGDDGTIRLWKLGSKIPYQVLEDELQACPSNNWTAQCSVEQLAFTGDGNRLAARYADNSLRFWDARTGRQIGTAQQVGGSDFLVTVDDTTIAANVERNQISLFDVNDAGPVERSSFTIDPKSAVLDGKDTTIRALAHNQHAGLLAAGLGGGAALVWDTETGNLLNSKDFEAGPISSIRFTDDGSRLFVAFWTGYSISNWDLANDKIGEHPMTGHEARITDLAVIDGGRRLVSAGADETIKIWDTSSGGEITTLPGHSRTIQSIAMVPERGLLISADVSGSILVRRVYRDLAELVGQVCVQLEGKGLAAAGYFRDDESLATLCGDAGPDASNGE